MSLLTSDYIGSWYFARDKDNSNLFYLLNSITNNTSIGVDAKKLIQGDAGVLVIDETELKEKTTLSGDALILKNSNGTNNVNTNTVVYKDIFDLLIQDYYKILRFFFLSSEDLFYKLNLDYLNDNYGNILGELGLGLNNKDLLSSASINLTEKISCTLSYETRYDRKFDFIYAGSEDQAKLPPSITASDFIAREARNYDCRYYIDGNQYKIKSGSLSISIKYTEMYLANTYHRSPFYSPQGHSVTGKLEIIAPHTSYNSIPVEANCSLLIGDRYLELGQASIKSSYERKIATGGEPSTISIDFTAYSRLGAGIDNTRWNTYYLNLLNKFIEDNKILSRTDLNYKKIFEEIKSFLGID